MKRPNKIATVISVSTGLFAVVVVGFAQQSGSPPPFLLSFAFFPVAVFQWIDQSNSCTIETTVGAILWAFLAVATVFSGHPRVKPIAFALGVLIALLCVWNFLYFFYFIWV